jgi:plastocyanin
MNYSRKEKSTSVDVIALVAALAFLGVVLLTIAPVTFPLQQQEAAAQQQQDNTTTTTTTTPMTTTNQSIMPSSNNKTFYVFGAEVEGLDEETAGIPGDIYTLPVIVVNRGDSVTVHFYNTEAEEEEEEEEATEEVAEERHSFTIDAQPYSVDIDVAPGESGNATFTANQEGIFPYYCKYHLPTMIGELVVLPASQPGTPPAPAT